MARHSAFDDKGTQPLGLARPEVTPDTPAMVQVLLRAHLLRGALAEATACAELLSALVGGQTSGLTLLVEAALDLGRVQMARTALSEAEISGRLAPHEAALTRSRIAQVQGDMAAAKAILLAAIDAMPDQPALRRALAEVMIASGTAADARAVLNHLDSGAEEVTPGRPDHKAE
jgi:Tfp pilus assembly protein PilF